LDRLNLEVQVLDYIIDLIGSNDEGQRCNDFVDDGYSTSLVRHDLLVIVIVNDIGHCIDI